MALADDIATTLEGHGVTGFDIATTLEGQRVTGFNRDWFSRGTFNSSPQTADIGTAGTTIFTRFQPSAPSLCITLTETTGLEPIDTHDGKTLERAGLQVLTRGARGGDTAGITLAKAAEAALHNLANTTLGTTKYLLVTANHAIAFIGRDKNGRPEWSQNYTALKQI